MELVAEIDRGGFGRVEKVRDENGNLFARKLFDPTPDVLSTASRDKLVGRFKREVLVQSKLPHEFFIPIFAFDLDCAEPWFIMPLAERNFATEIAEAKAENKIPKEAFADILNALEQLHWLGFTHRDLKPQNILLHGGRWKLSDFGLVSTLTHQTTTLTSTHSAWGSAMYSAPEQVVDFKHVTSSADIYSLGCILHDLFAVAPRIPYQKQTCAGSLGSIVEKCTEHDPKKRFKSVGAVRGALLTLLSQPTSIKPSATANEWIAKLESLSGWDPESFGAFVRYITRIANEDDQVLLFRAVGDDQLAELFNVDVDLWHSLSIWYCDHIHGRGFEWEYCDVIIRRLDTIYALGSFDCKAAAVLAAARLGSSHNRWFVMRRLIVMCGLNIDNKLAERLSIEIIASETQQDFLKCVEQVNSSLAAYHPKIQKVLAA